VGTLAVQLGTWLVNSHAREWNRNTRKGITGEDDLSLSLSLSLSHPRPIEKDDSVNTSGSLVGIPFQSQGEGNEPRKGEGMDV